MSGSNSSLQKLIITESNDPEDSNNLDKFTVEEENKFSWYVPNFLTWFVAEWHNGQENWEDWEYEDKAEHFWQTEKNKWRFKYYGKALFYVLTIAYSFSASFVFARLAYSDASEDTRINHLDKNSVTAWAIAFAYSSMDMNVLMSFLFILKMFSMPNEVKKAGWVKGVLAVLPALFLGLSTMLAALQFSKDAIEKVNIPEELAYWFQGSYLANTLSTRAVGAFLFILSSIYSIWWLTCRAPTDLKIYKKRAFGDKLTKEEMMTVYEKDLHQRSHVFIKAQEEYASDLTLSPGEKFYKYLNEKAYDPGNFSWANIGWALRMALYASSATVFGVGSFIVYPLFMAKTIQGMRSVEFLSDHANDMGWVQTMTASNQLLYTIMALKITYIITSFISTAWHKLDDRFGLSSKKGSSYLGYLILALGIIAIPGLAKTLYEGWLSGTGFGGETINLVQESFKDTPLVNQFIDSLGLIAKFRALEMANIYHYFVQFYAGVVVNASSFLWTIMLQWMLNPTDKEYTKYTENLENKAWSKTWTAMCCSGEEEPRKNEDPEEKWIMNVMKARAKWIKKGIKKAQDEESSLTAKEGEYVAQDGYRIGCC